MKLKIHFGSLKRRKVEFPKDKKIRPALSRLRFETLTLIKDFIPGSRVLDLFAGTGIFGIEALSMGAKHVSFVDKSKKNLRFIEKNLRRFNIPDTAYTLWWGDALQFLIKAYKKDMRFDIVFMDPPFSMLLALSKHRQKEYVLELLDRSQRVLNPKSIILLKLHKKIYFEIPKGLVLYTTLKFGINRVYVLLQEEYIVSTQNKKNAE